MKYSSFVLPVLLVVSFGMTGCGKSEKPADTSSKPAQARSVAAKQSESKEQTANDKLNAYTSAYNTLMRGHWSLPSSYETFIKRMSKAKASDSINFPTVSGFDNALNSLRKGRAITGVGMDDLDAAVGDMLEAGEKLREQEKELEPYFKSKAYKEDNLAKAKATFPSMKANYQAAIAAMNKMDALLTKYQRVEAEKRLGEFKAQGNMVRFHTEESMLYAQDLLALFANPEKAIKLADTYAKGDVIIVKLEASLEAQRKAIEEAKAKGEKHSSFLSSANGSLTNLVGYYRDVRQKKSPSAFNSMMKKYNDAVDNYNYAARH